MAQRRLINKSLGSSRKFLRLGQVAGPLAEFSQVLFTLLIPNTDDFGRYSGDAETAKYAVFPISDRPLEDFERALQFLHQADLIRLYETDGERYLEVANFEREQSGLHKRTKSQYPDPPWFVKVQEEKDPRRAALLAYVDKQWQAVRGCKLESANTKKDWVQFAELLKRTKKDPAMTVEALKKSLDNFLASPDPFHRNQGFAYWCVNAAQFLAPIMPTRRPVVEMPVAYACGQCHDTGRVVVMRNSVGRITGLEPWHNQGGEVRRCRC